MTKKNFVTLVLAVIGGLLFGIGMCCCLLPEWNAFTFGVALTAVGAVALLVLFIARWKMDGKHFVKPNMKTVGIVLYAITSTLLLGIGMCMIMVWNLFIWGILVGVIGILLLLGLIPMLKGFK